MSRHRYTSFVWFTLGCTVLVILWGAFVRASGAGAGCGNHWPLCNGEVMPQAPSIETLVELTHRLTSGVAFLLVVAMVVLARRLFSGGHRVRRMAWWSLIFMVGEALVGAALVLLELVADNPSITRAWVMAAHLINTFLLLGALTLTAHYAAGGRAYDLRSSRTLARATLVALVLSLVLGASGAVAALGDTLYPPGTFAEEIAADFSTTTPLLKQLRVLHPLIAVFASLAIFHLVGKVREAHGASRQARRFAGWLNLTVVAQLALGTLNIVLKAPVWMQLLHLLVADVLWVLLVLTGAAALAPGAAEPGAEPETDAGGARGG